MNGEKIIMNKLIKLVTSLLILFSVLLGSDQRIKTLGGNSLYWPDDDSNIEYFPQLVNNYNIAQISGIRTSSDSLYGKLIWGDNNKYGFSWYEANEHDVLNFYMGTGSLGLRLGLLSAATDTLDSGNETSELGLSGSMGANNEDLDLGLHVSTYSNDDGTTSDQHEQFTTDVYFRMAMDAWVLKNMAASLHYASSNDDFNIASTPLAFDITVLSAQLGFFNTINISDNATAMLAISTSFSSMKNFEGNRDLSIETIHLPNFTFGVEGIINEWAKARIGLNKNYQLTKKTNLPGGSTKSVRSGEDLKKAFGLGFNYGAFNLDLYVSEGLFTNPVQHIVGFEDLEPGSGPNSSSVIATVTYTW